jgi:hypothetical protein
LNVLKVWKLLENLKMAEKGSTEAHGIHTDFQIVNEVLIKLVHFPEKISSRHKSISVDLEAFE